MPKVTLLVSGAQTQAGPSLLSISTCGDPPGSRPLARGRPLPGRRPPLPALPQHQSCLFLIHTLLRAGNASLLLPSAHTHTGQALPQASGPRPRPGLQPHSPSQGHLSPGHPHPVRHDLWHTPLCGCSTPHGNWHTAGAHTCLQKALGGRSKEKAAKVWSDPDMACLPYLSADRAGP